MERTHPPHPPGGEPSPASNVLAALAAVSAEAAQTLLGLQLLVARMSPVPLDPVWLGLQLYPLLSAASAADRVVLDVLQLEDAGCVVTWAESGREWVALTLSPAWPHAGALAPPGAPSGRPRADPFSTVGEREKEKEEKRRRERARVRAREQVEAEEREQASRWEQEYAQPGVRKRPERPALLQAPPIGCPDHPQGTMTECGPCSTAWERRRVFLISHKYEQQLALFEESQWEGFDGEPF